MRFIYILTNPFPRTKAGREVGLQASGPLNWT